LVSHDRPRKLRSATAAGQRRSAHFTMAKAFIANKAFIQNAFIL
jgi:hypothetical protein